MFKPVKQSDRELSRQATAILHKHGISRAAFIRSALEAVVENQRAPIRSDFPIQIKLTNMKTEQNAIPDAVKQKILRTKQIQQQVKQFLGRNRPVWGEEEKKAFFDDLSGGL